MFFSSHHFSDHLNPEMASIIAKVANDVIDRHGKVVYGSGYDDGSVDSFTSSQKPTDTHVAIMVGISEMGYFDATEKAFKRDLVTESDEVISLRAQVEELKKQAHLLRSSR